MLTDFQIRKFHHLFDSFYDHNKNGVAELEDMMALMEQYVKGLGLSVEDPKAQEIIQRERDLWNLFASQYDRDNDGTITRDEFIQGLTNLVMERSGLEGMLGTYSDTIFDSMDINKDDKVTSEEYILVTYSHNPEQGRDVFDQLDINGNGYLNRDEIRDTLLEYYFGTDETHPSRLMFGDLQ